MLLSYLFDNILVLYDSLHICLPNLAYIFEKKLLIFVVFRWRILLDLLEQIFFFVPLQSRFDYPSLQFLAVPWVSVIGENSHHVNVKQDPKVQFCCLLLANFAFGHVMLDEKIFIDLDRSHLCVDVLKISESNSCSTCKKQSCIFDSLQERFDIFSHHYLVTTISE